MIKKMPKTNQFDQNLIDQFQLSSSELQQILASKLSPSKVDFADLYLQQVESESWYMEEGQLKGCHYDNDAGFGLRAIQGEKTGFAFSDKVDKAHLLKAAETVKQIRTTNDDYSQPLSLPNSTTPTALYESNSPLSQFTMQEKMALLTEMDQIARQLDPRVQQVFLNLEGSHEMVTIVNQEGIQSDHRPLVSFNIRVIVEQNGNRQQANSGGGGRFSYNTLKPQLHGYVKNAVRQALLLLDAKPAPAGTLPVVLGPGWPAVLLHEAVGHGLEADFNRKGSSVFSGRIGEQVASSLCTIVDQGNLPNRRGSLAFDDEGVATQETVLIENGVLKNYLQDRQSAMLMNTQPTGNGRRESYAHAPMPRMTNTFMRSGEHSPEEIIASVKHGVYAVDFAGGQVDITSGNFVFSMSEAYMIEDGKVTHPIKGATLIGNGPAVLNKISMVGNDCQLDRGIGFCGKAGQTVPVGVGQPTLKVDAITVGGEGTQ